MRVHGPLDVLKEAWVGYEGEKENVSIHVLEMRRCKLNRRRSRKITMTRSPNHKTSKWEMKC